MICILAANCNLNNEFNVFSIILSIFADLTHSYPTSGPQNTPSRRAPTNLMVERRVEPGPVTIRAYTRNKLCYLHELTRPTVIEFCMPRHVTLLVRSYVGKVMAHRHSYSLWAYTARLSLSPVQAHFQLKNQVHSFNRSF